MTERRKLEEAIRKALIQAQNEKNFLKDLYKEENFRYIVMNEISKIGDYGTFPNDSKSLVCLTFQFDYNKFHLGYQLHF